MKNEAQWKAMFVTVIILSALGLVGLFWWNTSHGDKMGLEPLPVFDAVNEGEFDTTAMKTGEVGVLNVSLSLRILPPSTKEEGRTVQVVPFQRPKLILRDDDPNRDIKTVCIISIWVEARSSESPQTGYGELVNDDQGLCHEMNSIDNFYETSTYSWTNDVTGEDEGSIDLDHVYYIRPEKGELQAYEEFNPLIVGTNFWFPYDPFQLTLDTHVLTSIEFNDGTLFYQYPPMYIEFQLLPSGGRPWDIKMKNEVKKDQQGSYEIVTQETYLNLIRPLLFRISFPLIIIAMVFFIALIPQISNPNVETVLGIMASLLFATFAVRSLLSPGDQIGQTIIDISILGLYALQILAGVLLVWRVRRFGKKDDKAPDAGK
jgi:hypothetical protein